jgi:Flp pilus assembly protein TadG
MLACPQLVSPIRTLRTRWRDQRGQAVVEFAIVLPILMLIILGILYFGRYESYSTQMTQLAEQGARDAAVDYQVPTGTTYGGLNCATNNNIAGFSASQATGEIAGGSSDAGSVLVKVDCNPGGATGSACSTASGVNNVTVCTQTTVQFPFLPIKTGTIYQSATMRVESVGTGGSGAVVVADSNDLNSTANTTTNAATALSC